MELEAVLQNKCMSKGVQTLCLNTFLVLVIAEGK